jgi:hypothetical protein
MKFYWPWQTVRHYNCPDGIRVVYRDLDEALPLYLSDHKEKTAAALKAVREIEAKVEIQHEDKVRGLLFKLNSYNESNQQHLRAAYLVYSSAPCQNLKYFIEAVTEVREFEARLTQAQFLMEKILLLLSKPAAARVLQQNYEGAPDQLSLMLNEVLDILARPAYVGTMIERMRQVSALTEGWRHD